MPYQACGDSRKIRIMLKNLLITTLILSAVGAVTPVLSPVQSLAYAATTYIEVNRVPDLLGFRQGDRLRSTGLATGDMQFTGLNHTLLDMNQQITLNSFARAAIEQVVGRSLTSKNNKVTFRFVVKPRRNGGFAYSLYDQGNRQLLMEGPVRIKVAKGASATSQDLLFEAEMVSMRVVFNKSGSKAGGQATFKVTGIPVPGSLNFTKI